MRHFNGAADHLRQHRREQKEVFLIDEDDFNAFTGAQQFFQSEGGVDAARHPEDHDAPPARCQAVRRHQGRLLPPARRADQPAGRPRRAQTGQFAL